MLKLSMILFMAASVVYGAQVLCETSQDGIKKISCKYTAPSQTNPRQVVFTWISPDNKADNRSKELTVPIGHVSVYDYRYFGGRAEGNWKISVTEKDTNTTVSTVYVKDSNVEVLAKDPKDPLFQEAQKLN